MDGPSARAYTTVPEGGNPREAGAVRQRKWFCPLFPKKKWVDRQGETRTQQRRKSRCRHSLKEHSVYSSNQA
jgi:hypothetical protein